MSTGENFRLFSSLEIPLGQGLSGWVAENRKPIINGNPSVEPGYLNDPSKFSTLRSALAVPLEGTAGVVGVLALYHAEKDAFARDHLRILLAISSKTRAVHRKRAAVPTGRNFGDHRLPDRPAQRPFPVPAPGRRTGALQPRHHRWRSWCAIWTASSRSTTASATWRATACSSRSPPASSDSCREYDYVARMGGDEFVVVAPGLTAEAAAKKAARLRDWRDMPARTCAEKTSFR